MRLSLEEMNILSERLEKEEARLHQLFQNPTYQGEARAGLQIISELQKKFRDLQAELTPEEKQMLSRLLKEEVSHIHGHSMGIYESILSKVNGTPSLGDG
ncbi:hypothetical protein [Thermoflavimicrobium dichotomicum]|uniref:Uncharacterized protein n=1 Tax=Thermoflavimicrobium dichotomicum TaxID=46223 RepID=A0A1I3MXE6_9BACL|nr:hypothetical protein [Thermoflavimicrobium dichotomicum]SFJ01794.1 hypothetical protein SAMN05421852_103247 [Thermoflavimicrobium dichotomicum]